MDYTEEDCCRYVGCYRPIRLKRESLCYSHAHMWRHNGEDEPLRPLRHYRTGRQTIEETFEDATYTDHRGCRVWKRSVTNDQYGKVWYDGRFHLAHRLAWELAHGRPVPEGLEVEHLCRNRRCCLPEHLDVTTHQENCRRRSLPAREHLALAAA